MYTDNIYQDIDKEEESNVEVNNFLHSGGHLFLPLVFVGGWWLLVVGGSFWLVVGGSWWLVVAGGWWLLVGGGCWWVLVVGGNQTAFNTSVGIYFYHWWCRRIHSISYDRDFFDQVSERNFLIGSNMICEQCHSQTIISQTFDMS